MKIDFTAVYSPTLAAEVFEFGVLHPPQIYAEIVVPTEVILCRSDQPVMLRHARVYHTLRYARAADFDRVLSYDDWFKIDRQFNLNDAIEVLLAEIWENHGSDGHYDWWWEGTYRALSSQDLSRDIVESRSASCVYVYERFVRHYLNAPDPDGFRRGPMDWDPR